MAGKPAGILTAKDCANLIHAGADLQRPMSDYMSRPLVTVTTSFTLSQALEFLHDKPFDRLVVCDDAGDLLGMVRQKELITVVYSRWAELLRNHQEELRELVGMLQRRSGQMEYLAVHDRLTGLLNRHGLEEALSSETDRVLRYGSAPFSLLFFDLDGLKGVNDCHGHLMGDEVLRHVGTVVRECVRSTDIAARWGGDEFVVLLICTPLAMAREVAEKLRRRLSELQFDAPIVVSGSFGVGEFHPGEPISDLIARVDEAMYRSKKGGKNLVCVAGDTQRSRM